MKRFQCFCTKPYTLLLSPIITHHVPPPQLHSFQLITIIYSPLNKQFPPALLIAHKMSTSDPWLAFIVILFWLISHWAKGDTNSHSQPKEFHQTTFYSLIIHPFSTTFSPKILPPTHSTTSLHQPWPLLILFPFWCFLGLLTITESLCLLLYFHPPLHSVHPLTFAFTLSLTSLQHLHDLLLPLKLRSTLQLISLSFQYVWFLSNIAILLRKGHSLL